ncbi:MAG: hypothetical protein E7456_05700 [Ruminococcaceae bacterium]|nr:hypothetical protein [Oscillospiraceae bacterium]
MRKKQMTALACVLVYLLSFGGAAAVMGTEDTTKREPVAAVETAAVSEEYTIREHNGMVAVFRSGEDVPLLKTDIPVDGLRTADRELMERGIALESYTEVLYMLEDFDS